jgi:predicted alpha/beta-hydrolase family hydrolase
VLFSYPLHPPGGHDRAAARSAHLPSIRCPTLFLSGESDPFARIDLLRTAAAREAGPAELVTYPKLGHTLKPVLEDVLDRVARFLTEVAARTSD